MPELSWRHHTLIQALLSRGPLKEEEFHTIFTGITGKNPETHQQMFNDYLLKINTELSYVQFELRGCRNQYDGKVYYGVVNNVADEQSKLGTKYTIPQIAFYKGVIDAIVQDVTAQGSISNIDALNIRLEDQVTGGMSAESQGGGQHQVPPALKNFSISQKEKTLGELVKDQWLCSTSNGTIGLGVRSFLDLRSWFHNNDVPSCEVCNEGAVKAELCQNEGCNVRIHTYCLKKKFSQKMVKRVCPGCGVQWKYPESIAEATEEDDELNGRPPNGEAQTQTSAGPSKRKRPKVCLTEDANKVGSDFTRPDLLVSVVRRATRSSARAR